MSLTQTLCVPPPIPTLSPVQLVVLNAEPMAKQSSAVLVSILVTGLLVAAGLIGGYLWMNHRKGNGKGMRLVRDSGYGYMLACFFFCLFFFARLFVWLLFYCNGDYHNKQQQQVFTTEIFCASLPEASLVWV